MINERGKCVVSTVRKRTETRMGVALLELLGIGKKNSWRHKPSTASFYPSFLSSPGVSPAH
jgi:hypothetical protein